MSKPRVILLALAMFFPAIGYAQDFTLDFTKKSVGGNITSAFYDMDCGAGSPNLGCAYRYGGEGNDATRFVNGHLWMDGVHYLHQIIGDPASGFVQEVLYRNDMLSCDNMGCFNGDGLDSVNNNAAENPTATVMRQVIDTTNVDGTFTSEYLKDRFANRAKITQDFTTGSLTSSFAVDGRNSSITSMPAEALHVDNTLTIVDPGIPVSDRWGPGATFDINDPDDHPDYKKYHKRVTDISSGNSYYDATGETYVYADANEDYVLDIDWFQFFDQDQNPDCNTVRVGCN